MLKAKNKETGELFISWKQDKEIIPIKDKFICPSCDSEVSFVDAQLKIKHFRHKVESECNPEPETEEHLQMKQFFQNELNLEKDEIEVNLGFAKPDIFLKERHIAIEVQHSNISSQEFIERCQNYTKAGIYVLWVFHEDLVTKRPSAMLRKAHILYYGRIYCYHNHKIYPIHFESDGRWIEVTDFGGGYWKWYKQQKILVRGEQIEFLNILTTKNDWENILIGRFYDKKFWKSNEVSDELKWRQS